MTPVLAVDGVIPNLAYPPAEQFTAISPQLSSLHLNQPSVYNGYVIFAGNAVHEVWDIANPYAPVKRAEMLSNFRSGEAESHQVTYARKPDGTAYMATISGKGIDIWNVTNTTAPAFVSQLQLPNINYGDVTGGIWGVAWQGNHLYAGATTFGLYVIDVSNPAAPVHIATVPRASLGNVPAGPLYPLGSTLVVTTPKSFAGIATVDISNPLLPRLLDSVIPSGSSYIGGFYNGNAHLITPFRSYDVTTDPSDIQLVGSVSTPSGEYASFANHKLFFGGLRGGTHGIYKYDITNPASPVLEGRFIGRDTRWDDQFSCPIGNLLAVADDQLVDGHYVGGLIVVHDTAPDTVPPAVLKVYPADGATGQPLTGTVSLSLSEWPELATVDPSSFIVRPVGGSALAGTWSTTHTVLSFGSDAPLLPHTNYEIVLPAGGVKDLVGNPIATPFRSTFRTGAGSVTGFPGAEGLAPVPPTELGESSAFALSNTPVPGNLYQWSFGDGTGASGSSVSHTYAAPGRYPVRLDVTPTAPLTLRFEAESATLTGGVVTSSTNPGFSGSGFADFPGGQGSTVAVTWNVTLAQASHVQLRFRYANGGTTARPLHLVVNDGTPVPLTFAPTGAWTTYLNQNTPAPFFLPAGTSTIVLRATNGSQGGNIDRLDLSFLDPAEDEDAELVGNILPESANPGFTGSGYANYEAQGPGVMIRWTFTLAEAATLPLTFRYANGGASNRPLNLVVDGGAPETLPFAPTTAWSVWSLQSAASRTLAAGPHTVELVCDAGSSGPNLDSLLLPGQFAPPTSVSFTHIVHRPLTARPPARSGPLALDAARTHLWAVNPDADSVTRLDAATLAKIGEFPTGDQPENLAVAPDGKLWIVNHGSATLTVLQPDGSLPATIPLPRGSQPYGLVFAPAGNHAYLALEALGRIVRLDATTGAITASLDLTAGPDGVTPTPRGLALDASGTRLFATRFLSPDSGGKVHEIDTATFTLTRTIDLSADPGPDSSSGSRGIPNYLSSITISPDGTRAWLPSKKDNILRGTLLDGNPLTHDQSVRSITSVIDLALNTDLTAERADYDNRDRSHAADFSTLGDLAFVTQPGNNQVEVIDTFTRASVTQLAVGRAPTGVLFDAANQRLFVLNYLDRSISGFDVAELVNATGTAAPALAPAAGLVATEPLAPEVLHGKRLFYDATSARLNEEGYMSCASCHLDGSHDGRTWDFTGFGEGLRNTIDLRGRAGTAHGRLHWSANFDEVHDFEGQIRGIGAGLGLMENSDFSAGTRAQPLGDPKAGLSSDLDTLAAYVASLATIPESPHRQSDGSLTPDAFAGRALYQSLNCASCHSGTHFTDSPSGLLHDVGTLKPSSGGRLGSTLAGIDTPTLRGVWATAPYFHDGSAPDLAAVLATGPQHDVSSALNPAQKSQLIVYLQQIDSAEPAAPAVAPATIGFAELPAKTTADPAFALVATSSNGLPVNFTSSDPDVATISGDTVTLVGPGSAVITASQAGDALRPAAVPVLRTLVVTDPAPTFAGYLAEHFTAAELLDPSISGHGADADRDGVANLLEYALGGTDPTDRAAAFPVITSPQLPPPGPRLRISFLRRSGGTETSGTYLSGDLTYQPVASADLTDWIIAPVPVPNPSGVAPAPDGFEWASYAIRDSPQTAWKGFIRLRVEAE